ncbi:hypothetical protein sscle_08g067640 [Sclerotinia sclerotiorum 1980 UF-70]|uniref:GDP-fucose protein O-fucosyltransferase n=1 Tax=Sclerotinia sclerotiorum (strain ATCC 18683 / 1980 / Ss-1) TaxID=665079 RepID=A0A1D9QAK4_SCLS1|nr:hypothetical protein sscle_08g067640 [Sclerotinia sclerotiorum 1980 UF-70]
MVVRLRALLRFLPLFFISCVILYHGWNFMRSTEITFPSVYTAHPQAGRYFEQVFSIDKPKDYDFPALKQQCEQTEWPKNEVYLDCTGIFAGLTTIVSQVKICLKMALDTGHGTILPSIHYRDKDNLQALNQFNEKAIMTYGEWFEEDHLLEQMKKVCPQMRIIKLHEIESGEVTVQHRWSIELSDKTAPGLALFQGYFWKGRGFKDFFDAQYSQLEQLFLLNPSNKLNHEAGITAIDINPQFLIFRITDDPTGQELKLWNELGYLVRFKEPPRRVVNRLLAQIDRPFYGVHFRVESDQIWSSLENQLQVDLDALDRAWAKYGKPDKEKPLVYLACGDQNQVLKFVEAGKARGWEVTHKWKLAEKDVNTLKTINKLSFDFQGAIDMGVMLKSRFFLGITGSAFSSSVANARDSTGRYRGSSFSVFDDGGARTHLFNDGESSYYPCCL